jgi:hypothetical protein
MISSIRRPTAMALALTMAAAKDLSKNNKVDHQIWVARAVADRVTNTNLGTKREKSTKIRSWQTPRAWK